MTIIIFINNKSSMKTDNAIIKEQYYSVEEGSLPDSSETTKVKCQRKSKARKTVRQNQQKYHWKRQENIKYLEFIVSQRSLFDLTLEEKKYIGINKMMSDYIKTRDSVQCHSHHQKMLKKYGGIDMAISQLTSLYVKKSSRHRKVNDVSVKIEEVSFWPERQEQVSHQLIQQQFLIEDGVEKREEGLMQVKVEQP